MARPKSEASKTAAQRQREHRQREQARILIDANLATGARNLYFNLMRAQEQGVSTLTIDLSQLTAIADVSDVLSALILASHDAAVTAKKQRRAARVKK